MTTPKATPQVLHRADQFQVVALEDILLMQMLREPDADAIDRLSAAIHSVARSHARVVVILRLTGDASRLPEATQHAITRLLRESFAKCHAWAVVVEHSGATGAELRAQLTNLHAGAGVHLRMRILSGMDIAARWACELSTRIEGAEQVLSLLSTANR